MSDHFLQTAKLELLRSKARKEDAETRRAVANAGVSEILLAREQEKRDRELAANDKHKVYVFDTDTSDGAVKKCIDQLVTWSRQDPGCAIEIQINSPGGSIFAGFALIDFIRDLRNQGHHVTMVGLGMVASMAGVLMQAADTRVMGANAFMLIHEGSLGAIGDFGAVEDRVKLMELMHERILSLFEERSKVTKRFIKSRWQRRDWWFSAKIALEHGFIDEVR